MNKNYDFIFILVCLFVFRVILLSASFADAACLAAVLAYILGNKHLNEKKVSNELADIVAEDKKITQQQIEILAKEVQNNKLVTEGLKAANSFMNKR
jgi:hypothetical protein